MLTAVGYYCARTIRMREGLCCAGMGIGGEGGLIKRNDPDFKKVNIFPHMRRRVAGQNSYDARALVPHLYLKEFSPNSCTHVQ